jgi:thiamine-phosphate pyrophosphorylase
VRLFQVRAKDGIDGATLIAIVSRVRAAGGLTIVNDDIGLARLADGVHLGQEDAAAIDLREVRRALGKRVIGLSCGTPEEARAADSQLVDYLGVGPLFVTATKADAGAPIGIAGARAVIEATALPCAAIGGISLERLPLVRESGAVMAAMASALVCKDPESAARACVELWG